MKREKETLRYLGFHGQEADEKTGQLVQECFAELGQAAVPRHIYQEYPLHLAGSEITVGCMQTTSKNLSKNLRNCSHVLLFAATLGSQVDIMLKRYGTLQMSKAVVMQAAAAALLEEYCDEQNEKLKQIYRERQLYLRPRFSPGYGDFSLACQRDLFALLEPGKRIGITLTDSLLMVPTKSVTAVIGISSTAAKCTLAGCEACGQKDCAYRRNQADN